MTVLVDDLAPNSLLCWQLIIKFCMFFLSTNFPTYQLFYIIFVNHIISFKNVSQHLMKICSTSNVYHLLVKFMVMYQNPESHPELVFTLVEFVHQ